MELTEKQARFVDYYVETGNAAEAARRAGYAEKSADVTGRENLRKPTVKAAIDERLAELKTNRIADANEILEFFTSVVRGDITDKVIDKDGNVNDVPPSIRDRIAAGKELAKRYGLDKQVIEIANANDKPFSLDLSGLSRDELMRMTREAFGKERKNG